MYNTLKKMIPAGGYKLADMQGKIKKLFVLGDLSEAQVDELLALAAAGVSSEAERPELMASVRSLSERLAALELRVAALDGGSSGESSGGYEVWVPWDGLSDKYRLGAVVSHNGRLWESVYSGQNVWEPGAVGTEALWRQYIES